MAKKAKDLMDDVIAELSDKPSDWKVSNRQFVAENFDRLVLQMGPGKHSANRIADTLTGKGRKISGSTLQQYMNAERKKRDASNGSSVQQKPKTAADVSRPVTVAADVKLPELQTPSSKKFKAPRPV